MHALREAAHLQGLNLLHVAGTRTAACAPSRHLLRGGLSARVRGRRISQGLCSRRRRPDAANGGGAERVGHIGRESDAVGKRHAGAAAVAEEPVSATGGLDELQLERLPTQHAGLLRMWRGWRAAGAVALLQACAAEPTARCACVVVAGAAAQARSGERVRCRECLRVAAAAPARAPLPSR